VAENDEQDDDGGGLVRSPRYPQISLEQAVAKVKSLYDADKTAGTPMSALWPKIGYKGKSGPAAGALAAMKRFGLIEVRSGRAFPTKRAITIIRLPPGDVRRNEALREAFLSPSLYSQLMEQYEDSGLPSEESLNHELAMGEQFNHNSIPALVKDFLDSAKYAGLTDASGVLLASGGSGDGDDPPEVDETTQETRKKAKQRVLEPGTKEDVYSLDHGAVVVQWPERIQGASTEDIDNWLKLVGGKLKRAVNDGKSDDKDDASK